MRAARVQPLTEESRQPNLGPQLVPPREMVSAQVPQARVEQEGRRPFVMVVIVAIIAFTLAFTFVSTVMMWVWFRNTGVDWMFQRS